MLRLNLACGTDIRDGWVNLDVVARWPLASRGCDVIWDARTDRLPYEDGTVQETYAGYLFLHLAPQHHGRVLADIRRVLFPGGRLVVGEVDMESLMYRWLRAPSDPYMGGLIWGEQGQLDTAQLARLSPEDRALQMQLADFDKHCQGFTETSLRDFLRAGGFNAAKRINVHGPAVWYELTLETFR